MPVSTTFTSWVSQPAGATESGDQITWNGTVIAGQSLTFTFVASHTGSYEEVVSNTAVFNHSSSSGISNVATFAVVGPPAVTLVPTSLDFGNQAVGTTSATQTVTLTNTGVAALSISSITISGDFNQTNNCPATLTSNNSCTIQVSFSPTITGSLSGLIMATTNTSPNLTLISLAGTGIIQGPSAGPMYLPIISKNQNPFEGP